MVKGPDVIRMSRVGATRVFGCDKKSFFCEVSKEGKRCTEEIKTRNSEQSSSKWEGVTCGRRIAIVQ